MWLPIRLLWPQLGKVVVGVVGRLLVTGASLELLATGPALDQVADLLLAT